MLASSSSQHLESLFPTVGNPQIRFNPVESRSRHLPAHIAQLEAMAVPGPHGPIPLRDLARVVRGAIPTHNAVALDGRPSVAVTVIKQPGAATTPVTRTVQTTLD